MTKSNKKKKVTWAKWKDGRWERERYEEKRICFSAEGARLLGFERSVKSSIGDTPTDSTSAWALQHPLKQHFTLFSLLWQTVFLVTSLEQGTVSYIDLQSSAVHSFFPFHLVIKKSKQWWHNAQIIKYSDLLCLKLIKCKWSDCRQSLVLNQLKRV